jgi:hypothetical protein
MSLSRMLVSLSHSRYERLARERAEVEVEDRLCLDGFYRHGPW